MNSFPKISIVTPSYNQGQYIEQTILSVINQNYPNIEYIIIDGGSTDNTVEIIKKYEDKITYWVSEKDKGQSDALNKGLAKCTGDIFNWINSDDYFEQGTFAKLANYFKTSNNVDMVCGYCNYFESNIATITFKHRLQLFENVEKTLIEQKINQPATFYKLSVINSLGGINTDLHYGMDLDLWFRYLLQFGQENIMLVDDLFAHFRLHDESKTVQLQERFRKEENLIWGKLLSTINCNKRLIKYFSSTMIYNSAISWSCIAVNKKKLVSLICQKHFFEIYKIGNTVASKFAWWNLFTTGKIKFEKVYFGIFYNLYFKKSIRN